MDTTNQNLVSPQQTSMFPWVDSLWFRILLISLLGLGIFFRLAGLGNKIYSHDEAYTSLYAAGYRGGHVFTSLWDGKIKTIEDIQAFLKPNDDNDVAQIIRLLALYSPHQAPLFFILEHYWMQLIGYTPAAMRGLAALFSCLSIPAMYWFAKELFHSSPAALISAALFAIAPYHILFAQDARPYSLWTLVTILSSAAFLRAMQENSKSIWALYSLTLMLGVYSHQLFILVAMVHGIYFISVGLIKRKERYGGFLSASLFAFLVYAPWLFFVITRWQQATKQVDILNMQVPWYRFVQRWILLFSSPLIDFDFNSDAVNLAPYLLRVLMLILIVCAFVSLLKHGSQQQKILLPLIYIITIGIFIVLDLLFGGMRSITGRYFVPANIATILIVTHFLMMKLEQARLNNIKWRLLISFLILGSVLSNLNILQAETWWNKELSRVRIEFVHEISRDETLLIVSGMHPTNLGDILSLSFEVDSDVYFRLSEHENFENLTNYDHVYWFPSSYQEVQEISKKERLQVREVLPGTLWQIEGKLE